MNSVFVTVTSLIGRIRDENGNLKTEQTEAVATLISEHVMIAI